MQIARYTRFGEIANRGTHLREIMGVVLG